MCVSFAASCVVSLVKASLLLAVLEQSVTPFTSCVSDASLLLLSSLLVVAIMNVNVRIGQKEL